MSLDNSNVPLISRSFSEGLGYGFGFGIPVPGRANSIDRIGIYGAGAGDLKLDQRGLSSSTSGGGATEDEIDFLLAISSDEKLLTRLNEIDGAETVSSSGKGTDAKWKLESEEVVGVLKALQVAGGRGSEGRAVWI